MELLYGILLFMGMESMELFYLYGNYKYELLFGILPFVGMESMELSYLYGNYKYEILVWNSCMG